MALKHIALVDTATGQVKTETTIDESRTLPTGPGQIVVDCAPFEPIKAIEHTWNGSSFDVRKKRVLSYLEWLGRFTEQELDDIERMAETQPRVRVFEHLSTLRGVVNLDGDAIGYLNFLKAQNLWPSAGVANTRIAEMLSDG